MPHKKRNMCFKTSAKPVRDQDKADIIRGGDFHILRYILRMLRP